MEATFLEMGGFEHDTITLHLSIVELTTLKSALWKYQDEILKNIENATTVLEKLDVNNQETAAQLVAKLKIDTMTGKIALEMESVIGRDISPILLKQIDEMSREDRDQRVITQMKKYSKWEDTENGSNTP